MTPEQTVFRINRDIAHVGVVTLRIPSRGGVDRFMTKVVRLVARETKKQHDDANASDVRRQGIEFLMQLESSFERRKYHEWIERAEQRLAGIRARSDLRVLDEDQRV